jgi:hypothetical protein
MVHLIFEHLHQKDSLFLMIRLLTDPQEKEVLKISSITNSLSMSVEDDQGDDLNHWKSP